MARISSFIVEGRGDFPLDMLRFDMCWPRSADDAQAISGDGHRFVHLETAKRMGITFARWESFGWRVRQCLDESGLVIPYPR